MKKPKDTRGALRRMLNYLGPWRYVILAVLILSLASNLLNLWGPSLAGSAIREAAAGPGKVNFEAVTRYALLMLLCYVGSALLGFGISLSMTVVSRRVSRQMRQDVFNKLMRLPVGYFDRHQAGDIISRVSYDIDVISTCMATDIVQILSSLVTVVGSLFMMISISLPLSAVTLITVPVSILYTVHMRKKTQPRYARRSKSYGVMNGFVEEMHSGQKTIQAYAYEGRVDERFGGINRDAADAFSDAEYYGVTMGPTMSAINNLSLSLIGLLGGALYLRQLLLPFGNIAPVLADDRIISLGKPHDEGMDAGSFRGRDHLFDGRVFLSVGDVLKNGAVKHPGILQHHGIGAPDAAPGGGADFLPVDADATPSTAV